MAELALAIIPIGLKTCSGLLSYVGGVKDRDDAIARLARQIESLEGSFQLLDTFLKRGQLDPTTSPAAAQTLRCLKNCEDGLDELKEFEEKISSSIAPDPKMKDKAKDYYRKLSYPLQQTQLRQLENTLDNLCTPLNVAIQNLQLEIQVATSSSLVQQTIWSQKTDTGITNLSNAIGNLSSPMSNIQSQLPVIQSSVDTLAPQINLMMQAQFKTQMEEFKLLFQADQCTAPQQNVRTNELVSNLRIDNRNHTPAAYKLASKPSALATLANSLSACRCRVRRLRNGRAFKLGPLHLTDMTSSDIPHYKDCDFYSADTKSSRIQALKFTGLVGWIGKAIEITFRTTRGAGAFVISPSLRYVATVDGSKAPVFQVLWSLLFAWQLVRDQAYKERVVQEGVWKLQEIFRSGRGRPTDVNGIGDSPLHMLATTLYVQGYPVPGWLSGNTGGMFTLFQSLINMGVPTDTVGASNCLAFHLAGTRLSAPTSILRLLLVENADITHVHNLPYTSRKQTARAGFTIYDRESPRCIEALFEPLGVAIIRNDLGGVKDLIEKYPEYLDEVNFEGETYCSMAVENPEALELIVKQTKLLQLTKPSRTHYGVFTPLAKAMRISSTICETAKSGNESICPCITAVRILLDAGCPIMPHVDFRRWSFRKASRHCKALIAQELRNRRRDLRSLAQKELSREEYHRLCSSTAELDCQAFEVEQLLYRKGKITFGRLSTAIPSDICCSTTATRNLETIYLYLHTLEDACIFWELGFRDMNDGWAYCPANNILIGRNWMVIHQLFYSLSPPYALWLADHCLPLWELICHLHTLQRSDLVLADIIGRHARQTFCIMRLEVDFSHIATVINLPTIESADDCNCQCSTRGYKPFGLVMKWLITAQHPFEQQIPPSNPKSILEIFLDGYSELMNLGQHTAIARQITFQALGMQHTCTDRPSLVFGEFGAKDYDVDANETSCIQDLEKGRYLDALVSEFSSFVLQACKTTDYKTIDGPSSSGKQPDHRSTVNHRRVLEFWNGIWPLRIQQIKDELAAGWSPDLEVLQDLGVSLRYEGEDGEGDSEETETEDESDLDEDWDARHLSRFRRKLDII
ncbi:hypothetical protein FGRMN_8790 [Fusarium graminum]|nr:hypothetical protein FGRMN_8790 [Fusarium graminum]